MKRCTKCGVEKPLSGFYRDRTHKDGWCTQCKACRKAYSASKRGKEAQRRGSRRKRKRFPEKIKATNIVNHAIRDGKLERPTICPSCDTETFVEAHHPDYTKPLDVDWLCKECHKKLHRKERLCV